ncbi:MAG: translation initiation factor IF-6 [Candidatus Micrarchaeota archaeon]|nr:translation initiation factor IF-6 [Candidatus Micrarchaeota archaeon]
MSFLKSSNFGNPHIGLFARASEKLVAVDISASPKLIISLDSLNVPIMKTTFGSSGFAGIHLTMNSNGAVLPSFCSKEEMDAFKSWDLNVFSLSGEFSAVGNNIAANDFGGIANPEMPRAMIKRVSDCLGVEIVPHRVAGYLTAGSSLVATNKGFAAHNRCDEAELKELGAILKVQGANCTLNTGVAFVGLGCVANSHGAVFGEATTGFEVGRVAQALGMV